MHTPLGVPVLPEVWMMYARSSPRGRATSTGTGTPGGCAPTSTTGHPAGPAGNAGRVLPAGTTTAESGRWATMDENRCAGSLGSSGTNVAPALMAARTATYVRTQ